MANESSKPCQESRPSGNCIFDAGVPLIALPEPLPLYRDLVIGDEGEDVLAVQKAFAAAGQ